MNKYRKKISKEIKKLMRMDRFGKTSYKEAKKLRNMGFRGVVPFRNTSSHE